MVPAESEALQALAHAFDDATGDDSSVLIPPPPATREPALDEGFQPPADGEEALAETVILPAQQSPGPPSVDEPLDRHYPRFADRRPAISTHTTLLIVAAAVVVLVAAILAFFLLAAG